MNKPNIYPRDPSQALDVKEKSTEIEEMFEQENAPNSTDTLYTDAEDEKENVAKPSTDEQDGTIDETINEEVSPKFSIKRSMRNLACFVNNFNVGPHKFKLEKN